MDNNGKLFGILSIFDLIIIALLLFISIGTYYRFNFEKTNIESGEASISYSVNITGVKSFTLDYYKEGLLCFDAKTGEEIGVIKEIKSNQHKDPYMDEEGKLVMLDVPEAIDIELYIETKGLETEEGYFARGIYEIKTGSLIYLTTKYVEVEGIIKSIN